MRSTVPLFLATLAASAPALATEAVPVPQFRTVELNYGGKVTIVPGPVQRVTIINGSTQFTSFRVVRDGELQIAVNCHGDCPHHYNLQIRIESPQVPSVAVHAGGTIVVAPGFAAQRQISAAVSAGGTIDLRALAADHVSAAVNAGGDIYVRPRSTLSAAVNAGGDIHYLGNPQVSMAVQNGGAVSHDD